MLLFGILAIEVKRKAPTCHTFLEIIQARWGDTAHKVFLFFALLTNIIVTSMLLLGGAATVNALTGLNLNLASFLIPWGVIAYTMHGGLKATFLASYTHTTVLFVALLIFVFVIYAGDDEYVGRCVCVCVCVVILVLYSRVLVCVHLCNKIWQRRF